jgi:cysteine desulfuration protein SufE
MPTDLNEIISEFAELDPRERLEMLLDYSENLPPLPDDLEAQRLAGEHRIHECQTPVFLWIKLVSDERGSGKIDFQAWVAPEAPTVKGFVGILRDAFHDQPPEVALSAPSDLLKQLGLDVALGMTRSRGLSAILFYLRKQVERAMTN